MFSYSHYAFALCSLMYYEVMAALYMAVYNASGSFHREQSEKKEPLTGCYI